jgi:hypothetical protein
MRIIVLAAMAMAASYLSAAAQTAPRQLSARELIADFDAKLARGEDAAAAIGEMYGRDQYLRSVIIAEMHQPMSEATRHVLLTGVQHHFDRIDGDNTRRLKAILDHMSWEELSALTPQTANEAFTLISHSPDHEFQRRMVAIFEPLARAGSVPGDYVALLADDLAQGDGRPQVYGTNWDCINGVFQPMPTEDMAHIEQRRAEMHLSTFAEYSAQQRQLYGDCPPR